MKNFNHFYLAVFWKIAGRCGRVVCHTLPHPFVCIYWPLLPIFFPRIPTLPTLFLARNNKEMLFCEQPSFMYLLYCFLFKFSVLTFNHLQESQHSQETFCSLYHLYISSYHSRIATCYFIMQFRSNFLGHSTWKVTISFYSVAAVLLLKQEID